MNKILWVSPYALHDTSSGAAIFALTLLRYLKLVVGRDYQIRSLSAFVFDNPRGTSKFSNFEQLRDGDEDFFSFEADGIQCDYMRTRSHSEFDLTADEQRLFIDKFMAIVKEFRPDFIFGYGGDLTQATIFDRSRRMGIPTAYFLCNGNHKGYSFQGFDRVIVESAATARFYGENYGINCVQFGPVIDKSQVLSPRRDGKYITFINPVPEKGLAYFVKIAMAFKSLHPEIRFLAVASRGGLDADTIARLKEIKDGQEVHPYTREMLTNVDVAEHTANISLVYAETRVILVPSLCFEAWGRVATEATFNDIPVLASSQGGLLESVRGAGYNLDVPQAHIDDCYLLPSDEEIQPWLDKLIELYEHREDYQAACAKAAATNDAKESISRFIQIIEPLLQLDAGSKLKFDDE